MKRQKGVSVIQVIVAIAIVAIMLIIPIAERVSETTVTFTVEDKAIKRYDDDDKYLVYTDNGTYEITDLLVYWRWDSSDLYGKIKVGKHMKLECTAGEYPFFHRIRTLCR